MLDLDWIANAAGARSARQGEKIQSLWSGYGEIRRIHLTGAANDTPSVIVKWVKPPAPPRDAAEKRSDARKRRSYEVETNWYRSFAPRCDARDDEHAQCRIAKLIDSRAHGDERLLVLEDLDASGFGARRRLSNPHDIDSCLMWLAAFHARFLGVAPNGLWRTGTYWHLDTRPDELVAMDREDDALRQAAPILDRKLRACAFQTLVHGDAKLANFCFATTKHSGSGITPVAAVDFQYVGGGCGMKDVAYLVTGRSAAIEQRHLDFYFKHLRDACRVHSSNRDVPIDVDALESEWRALYPIACVDFFRFLAGWSKDHWLRDAGAKELTRKVLANL